MAKIVKRGDAPDGAISVSVGNVSFKVDADKDYTTDDAEVIALAQASEYLDAVVDDDNDPKAAAKAEAKTANELSKARAKAEKQRAEKAPEEPAAPKPNSVEELHELEDNKEEKD